MPPHKPRFFGSRMRMEHRRNSAGVGLVQPGTETGPCKGTDQVRGTKGPVALSWRTLRALSPAIVDFQLRLFDQIGVTIEDTAAWRSRTQCSRCGRRSPPWTTVVSLPRMSGA